MEEPLEGEETGHRDGEDKLAEWVHGHPTPLWEEGEKWGEDGERRAIMLAMLFCFILKNKNHRNITEGDLSKKCSELDSHKTKSYPTKPFCGH